MRHGSKVPKLKRKAPHRRALLANQACSMIENGRIRTTLGKAKALRPVVEKLVTLAKRGDLHARRQVVAFLRHKEPAKLLFEVYAPLAADRNGGYTRIIKLGARRSDAAPMALIEFVDRPDFDNDDEDFENEEVASTAQAKAPATTAAAGTIEVATEPAESVETKDEPASQAADASEASTPEADSETITEEVTASDEDDSKK